MTLQMIPAWIDDHLQQVEKLAVHQRGLRHMAVSVFVVAGDNILLQRRAAGKYHSAGLWANTCCTHPNWNEAPEVCATRRLNEELGISGLVLDAVGQVEYRADVGQGLTEHEVVDVFVARTATRPDVAPDPQEVSGTTWTTLANLDRDLALNPGRYTRWLHIYLSQHRAQIFGTPAA